MLLVAYQKREKKIFLKRNFALFDLDFVCIALLLPYLCSGWNELLSCEGTHPRKSGNARESLGFLFLCWSYFPMEKRNGERERERKGRLGGKERGLVILMMKLGASGEM